MKDPLANVILEECNNKESRSRQGAQLNSMNEILRSAQHDFNGLHSSLEMEPALATS